MFMINSTTSYSDITKDPRFLAFSVLATENNGQKVTDENRYSISFDEFCEKLAKEEIVDPKNVENTYNTLAKSNWDWRIAEGWKSNPLVGSQILDIIKKSYELGLVTKDNMLLRNKAINTYKTSI